MARSLTGWKAAVTLADAGVMPAVVAALVAAGAEVVVDSGAADGATVVGPVAGDASGFLTRCEAAVGPLDILVVGSGLVRNKPILDVADEDLAATIAEELVQPAILMREAARAMLTRNGGRIVAFGSMSGKTGVHHNTAPAAAAKGGLFAFVRALAAEVAEGGVTVNAIATALFEPQTATMTEEKRTLLRGAVPVGRFGRSEEAAHAVLYLVDPDGGYVTGECLNLSGGRFMD
ncbi:SDR family NAD(P)-dependent oxidoreductase [Flavisphingomonas formosensis]|uniref:SDR family NAD(P)-dependent oxidoreductase n=1 Tax=Flavisphingomonas formosensis TaxID=861534 RepID=UPI0012F7DE35|nr:SDR family oxidoreductase [Sphingomonas formosensis]